jgi:hypothetical protein
MPGHKNREENARLWAKFLTEPALWAAFKTDPEKLTAAAREILSHAKGTHGTGKA